MMMNTSNHNVEPECKDFLNRFFDSYRNDTLQKQALKALRFLAACDEPLSGRPGGWAAGIVYALANRCRLPCGAPGLRNKDLEEFFGVTMGTIRERAVRVDERLAL
jgi:hypothetical protein